MFLHVEIAGEALQIDDARVAVGKREGGELSRDPGVGSGAVRKDLHRDVRLGTEGVQVFQLLAHGLPVADGAVQYGFVQDDP